MKKTRKAKPHNEIGLRVRKARLQCDPPVSQDALAGKLAAAGLLLDRCAISHIESRSRYLTDFEVIAIARALKVSVAHLYGEE